MVRRDAGADALDADGVEADEGDGEPAPQLLLELREHALDGDDEDPLPAPPLDELAEEDARLERLPEPDGVGDEDPLPRLLERLDRGVELVGHGVHGGPVPYVEVRVGGRRLPKEALDVEPRGPVRARRVRHERGLGRVEHLDVALEVGEEDGLLVADQLGEPHDGEGVPPLGAPVDGAHEPLGVADDDAGSGG